MLSSDGRNNGRQEAGMDTKATRRIRARFDQVCGRNCHEPVRTGQTVYWTPGSRVVVHESCRNVSVRGRKTLVAIDAQYRYNARETRTFATTAAQTVFGFATGLYGVDPKSVETAMWSAARTFDATAACAWLQAEWDGTHAYADREAQQDREAVRAGLI